MSVKLAIGLGNMGSKYASTRHNAGMEAVARLGRRFGATFARNKYCAAYLAKGLVGGREIIFAAAEGYMNESGVNLANILRFLKLDISEVAVFYDDITLDSGRMKISQGGSSGGHNGVNDIINRCGNDFARVRIGLGAKPFKGMDLADYVLGAMGAEELSGFEALLPKLDS
ncbi:MAG: aminoacyl-tRNA hydrolase, partial [Opitutales bacterium]|nr:aminoacyl-tRNA hydrolase [Opitutales bacterium]